MYVVACPQFLQLAQASLSVERVEWASMPNAAEARHRVSSIVPKEGLPAQQRNRRSLTNSQGKKEKVLAKPTFMKWLIDMYTDILTPPFHKHYRQERIFRNSFPWRIVSAITRKILEN